ncbi:MAG: universal stress protein, partial [Chloroflexota bacterium]
EHVKAVATGCNVPEVDFLFVVESLSRGRFMGVTGSVVDTDKLLKQQEDAAEKWGKDYLARVVKEMKAAGVAAKSVVRKGMAADRILDYVAKNNIDLVIMSTHGRSGPARWAMGSVSDKVIRHTDTPVLIVRPEGCEASA